MGSSSNSSRRRPSRVREFFKPVREFIRVDVEITGRALRHLHPATAWLFCAPSLFLLWVLDRIEQALLG